MIAPTYWRLDEALDLIRALQSDVRKFGYHLCLGGGVLNTGKSEKDLDLYFLSLDNQGTPNPDALIAHLENIWSCKGVDIWGSGTIGPDPSEVQVLEGPAPANPSPYTVKLMFSYSNLRIDVFILGGVRKVKEESDAESTAPAPLRGNPLRFRTAGRAITNIPWDNQTLLTERQQQQAEEIRAWARRIGATGAVPQGPPTHTDTNTGATGTWSEMERSTEPIFRVRR